MINNIKNWFVKKYRSFFPSKDPVKKPNVVPYSFTRNVTIRECDLTNKVVIIDGDVERCAILRQIPRYNDERVLYDNDASNFFASVLDEYKKDRKIPVGISDLTEILIRKAREKNLYLCIYQDYEHDMVAYDFSKNKQVYKAISIKTYDEMNDIKLYGDDY